MTIAEIDFSQEPSIQSNGNLEWFAERLTGLFGSENHSYNAEADKWVLGEGNNYFLHLDGKIARITSRYPLPVEVVDAIKTVLVAIWGLPLREVTK